MNNYPTQPENQQSNDQGIPEQSNPTLKIPSSKKYLLLGALGILLLVGLFVFLIFSSFQAARNITSAPTPTPVKNPSPTGKLNIQSSKEYKESIQKINQQQKTILEQEAAVGQLLHKLPYKGKYFSMQYSFEVNEYTVNIPPVNKDQGEAEFDAFLKANKIGDRKWIRNIRMVYK